ncbi:hypothetical protein [Sandarakinorhabdus rubra]|uniref:hypothetical protein n=1 Tax=Sandarakinorhabdus rubra TaxID=2672568 RepID=UPI0013DA3235|nr:hypothetical protein [Sandarakinorhabdus rubra]
MPHYLLPGLTHQELGQPAVSGQWLELPDLKELAADLNISQQADDAVIKSVPDAWAPVRAWRQALFNNRHQLHARTRRQWRALLALLALQPRFSGEYTLSLREVPLDAGNPRWRGVLSELSPAEGIHAASAQEAWLRPVLLRVVPRGGQSVDVAMLTPDTLLAAGHSATALRIPGVVFAEKGLADPLASDLSATDLGIIADYANGIVNALAGQGVSGKSWDGLARELQAYAGDIEALIGSGQRGRRLAVRARRLNLPFTGLHSVLDSSFETDPTQFNPGFSHTQLALRPMSDPAPFGGVVLIDEDLPRTIGGSAASIHVYRELTLKDALNDPARVKAKAAKDGWLAITVDELWTPCVVDSDGTPPAAHGPNCPVPLPVTPLALLLADGDRLRSAVRLTANGKDREATFEVRLEDGRLHTLRRRWQPDQIQRADIDSSMAVWPDFAAADWPFDFLQSAANPFAEVLPQAAVSLRLLQADLNAAGPGRNERAAGWGSGAVLRKLCAQETGQLPDQGEPWLQRMRFADSSQIRGEWQITKMGIEAIAVAVQSDALERSCGLVLVSRRAPALTTQERAKVAIDFGTTSSIAYVEANQRSEPAHLKARSLPIIAVDPSQMDAWAQQKYVTLADFFAGIGLGMPFPTMLKQRDNTPEAAADWPNAGQVLFVPPPEGKSSREVAKWVANQTLKAGLKWQAGPGGDGENNVAALRFLQDLVLRVAAELRDKGVTPERINWRFSYPQAFTDRETAYFKRMTEQVAQALSAKARVEHRTEAEAAMTYFCDDSEQAFTAPTQLSVMLDIGGGTTDIAIYLHKEALWRGSVRLAAGDFFSNWLERNSSLLKKAPMGGTDPTADLPNDDSHRKQRRLLIELAASKPSFSDQLKRFMDTTAGADPDLQRLQVTASTALAGLLWYTGRVLKKVLAGGQVDPRLAAHPTILMAGRGSSYFRLLTKPDQQHLTRMLMLGAGLKGNPPELIFSVNPKQEVARGLLHDAPSSASNVEAFLPLGLGLELQYGGNLTAEAELAQVTGKKPSAIDMADFQEFLDALKVATGINLTISQGGSLKAKDSIARGTIKEMVREAELTRPVKPPFVEALHLLVDMLAHPKDQRDQFLRVDVGNP